MTQNTNSEPQVFLQDMKEIMSGSPAISHKFLLEFENSYLDKSQLRDFAIQWYKTAKKHKEAFPALIYNVKDDNVRFDLIDILNEEYGNGERERIHARLLQRFLRALNVSDEEVQSSPTLPTVESFGEEVLRVWRDGNEVYAFGLHFALEFLASSLHMHFANGLSKYAFLSEYDREYFNFHKIAEKQHSDFSENGMLFYATTSENRLLLKQGVEKGIVLLGRLWDEFYSQIFNSKQQASTLAIA